MNYALPTFERCLIFHIVNLLFMSCKIGFQTLYCLVLTLRGIPRYVIGSFSTLPLSSTLISSIHSLLVPHPTIHDFPKLIYNHVIRLKQLSKLLIFMSFSVSMGMKNKVLLQIVFVPR